MLLLLPGHNSPRFSLIFCSRSQVCSLHTLLSNSASLSSKPQNWAVLSSTVVGDDLKQQQQQHLFRFGLLVFVSFLSLSFSLFSSHKLRHICRLIRVREREKRGKYVFSFNTRMCWNELTFLYFIFCFAHLTLSKLEQSTKFYTAKRRRWWWWAKFCLFTTNRSQCLLMCLCCSLAPSMTDDDGGGSGGQKFWFDSRSLSSVSQSRREESKRIRQKCSKCSEITTLVCVCVYTPAVVATRVIRRTASQKKENRERKKIKRTLRSSAKKMKQTLGRALTACQLPPSKQLVLEWWCWLTGHWRWGENSWKMKMIS